jgi:hypothetical protein
MLLFLGRLQPFGDTGFDVMAHHHLADPAQRLVDGRDLGQDFDAAVPLLDHPPHSLELPLDDAQTSETVLLDPFVNRHVNLRHGKDNTIPR